MLFPLNASYNPAFPPLNPISAAPYPMRSPMLHEHDYFMKNPRVAGMATEDNHVIFNPIWEKTATPQQKKGLYYLESARIHMKTDNSWKDIEFTDKQKEYFKSLGDEYYSKLGDHTKKTLISRIIAGDEIPDAPYTKEQQDIADKVWTNMTSRNTNKNEEE